jgi:DNA-binding NarL/FixJ family response regulator
MRAIIDDRAAFRPGLMLKRPLVGRERERHLLEGLLETVGDGGSATLLVGEAGVGKTALLAHVADVASKRASLRVLRADGKESEAVLAFAALADLLLPLREQFAELPHAQCHALEVCLALSSGPAAGPLAACAGALGVLARAAEDKPLILLVDDFQWIDPESQRILLFVARRLASEPVAMILTVREEPDGGVPTYDLPTLRIGGLSVAECAELAKRAGVIISPPVLRSLVERSGGNPLALLENLPGASAGPGGPEAERLTLGASLERAWGRVFDELPEDTQRALFVVATDSVSGGRNTVSALDSLGLSLGSLAAAERRGLVQTLDGQIQLRHPLMRSVVVNRTPLWARVAACRALADVADVDLRAWYLAAAATGPDDAAAEALVATAAEARHRNGYGAAARAWRRAADLTDDREMRAVRLLRAAADAHLMGDSGMAVVWCEEALEQRYDPVFAAEAGLVLGRARTWHGEPLRSFDGLVRAAEEIQPIDAGCAVALLAEATLPAALAGRFNVMRQVAQQVEELWEDTRIAEGDTSLTTLAMVAEAFVLSGELDRAAIYLDRAGALLPSADLVAEQQGIAFLAQGDIWTERYERGRLRLATVVDCGRRLGAPAILSLALGLSSELGWWTGQWASAVADATESLQWAQELNQAGLIGYSLSLLSRIEAARGDREGCEAHVERARRDVEPRGVGCLALYNPAALGLCALGGGELAVAIEHLERAWAALEAGELGNPDVVPFAGDLAEALARVGDVERAEQILDWLEERADTTGLAYPRAVAARARGILARDIAEAEAWFATANAAHKGQPMPFEQARTLLSEGEALRRAYRPVAARRPLRHALSLFSGLGARPWITRTMTEMAATGIRSDARNGASPSALDTLSPQELQVARAVGRGLSNVDAAAALFVSRKTVEAHLTRVYRKLGVHSRTELACLLLRHDTADQSSGLPPGRYPGPVQGSPGSAADRLPG